MDKFRVWVRPTRALDYDYLIYVDGLQNTRWLVRELAGSFVFGSAQPIQQTHNSTLCTFQVPRNPLLPFSQLQKLLTAMPQVTLLTVALEG
jgi:hypothetical protein